MNVLSKASGLRNSPYATFIASWLRAPTKVGAIAPSGKQLAALIVRDIDPAGGPVIEFGPGTGTFTAALIHKGLPEEDLVLVEFDRKLARFIAARYPKARLFVGDATRFDPAEAGLEQPPQAVISGLPLLSMSPSSVRSLLAMTFASLPPDCPLYQFTYGWRCPVRRSMLEDLGLEARRTGIALRNVPPAAVYRITRRAA